MLKKLRASGKIERNTRQATLPRLMLLNYLLMLQQEQRECFASIALAAICRRRVTCTITGECGWLPIWCIGGTLIGKLVPGGFCSIYSMVIQPATTSPGNGWLAPSATSLISSTVKI